MKRLFAILTLLVLAIMLTACATFVGAGEAARVINSRVINYGGPAALLESTPGTGELPALNATRLALQGMLLSSIQPQQGSGILGSGSIDASGNFTFEFNPSPPTSTLIPFGESGCSGITVSDPTVLAVFSDFLVVRSGTSTVGYLVLISVDPNTTTNADSLTMVFRVYVDADLSSQGTCTDDFGDSVTVDINFKQGWNILIAEATISDQQLTINLRSGGEPSNVDWYFTTGF